MTNGFFNKTSQKAQEMAKQVAKRAVQEPVEVLKHTKAQTVGLEAHPSIVEQILKSDNGKTDLTPQEKEKLKTQIRRRLKELEEELKKEREKRLKKLDEWRQMQEELMRQGEKDEVPRQLLEPVTKRKRGFLGFVKKKQGTKEMGKQII